MNIKQAGGGIETLMVNYINNKKLSEQMAASGLGGWAVSVATLETRIELMEQALVLCFKLEPRLTHRPELSSLAGHLAADEAGRRIAKAQQEQEQANEISTGLRLTKSPTKRRGTIDNT